MTTVRIANLYDDATPPIPGYEGVKLRVLLNPPRAILEDFDHGGFSATEHERAAMQACRTIVDDKATTAKDRRTYQARLDELERDIAERQQRMGRALHTLFGTSEPLTLELQDGTVTIDFTTPAAALATMEEQACPDELAYWLAALPTEIPRARREFVAQNLGKSFSAASPVDSAS